MPLLILLVNTTLLLHPHSDPWFLNGRSVYHPVVAESAAAPSGNPAGEHSGGKYQCLAGFYNHNGIADYNTIFLGGSISTERLSSFISLKHNSLTANDYSRTLGDLGINLKASGKLIIGTSIKIYHIQLPENMQSTLSAGFSAGAYIKASALMSVGLAGSYYKTVMSEFPVQSQTTALLLEFLFRTGKRTHLLLYGEMISNLKPRVMASVYSEISSGVRIVAGVGTGNEQLFAGISYDIGRIRPCFVSGFNPATGSSNCVLVLAQSRK